jgi:hypothetical protein
MKRLNLCVLCVALATACGGAAASFEGTARAPAAMATVKVSEGPNENTVSKLHVEHLAHPNSLRDDLTVYVAWIRPVGTLNWRNAGQLMVGDDLTGNLEIRSAFPRYDLAVSAETGGEVAKPSEFIVLEGKVGGA